MQQKSATPQSHSRWVFWYFDRGTTWLQICQHIRCKHFVTDLQILNEKTAFQWTSYS